MFKTYRKANLWLMELEMFLNGRLVDSCPLSVHKIHDSKEREAYIQGAVNALLEKWEDLINDQELKPQFFVKGRFPFS